MAKGTPIRLAVALECDDDTIRGTVDDHAGDIIEFSGWLELMSAFDISCARAHDHPRSHKDPGPRRDRQ